MTPAPAEGFVERNRLWSRLGAAVASLPEGPPTPVAVVDLDAFDANAADLVRRAGGKPVRVASNAARCLGSTAISGYTSR